MYEMSFEPHRVTAFIRCFTQQSAASNSEQSAVAGE